MSCHLYTKDKNNLFLVHECQELFVLRTRRKIKNKVDTWGGFRTSMCVHILIPIEISFFTNPGREKPPQLCSKTRVTSEPLPDIGHSDTLSNAHAKNCCNLSRWQSDEDFLKLLHLCVWTIQKSFNTESRSTCVRQRQEEIHKYSACNRLHMRDSVNLYQHAC